MGFVFHWNHSRNEHQKFDELDSGSESAKRKRLFRYVFMREKSIAGSAWIFIWRSLRSCVGMSIREMIDGHLRDKNS
jgi:hypothetical protein